MKNKLIIILILFICISTIGTASAKQEERWCELQIDIGYGNIGVMGNEFTWKLSEGPFYPRVSSYYPDPEIGGYTGFCGSPTDYGIYKLNGTLVTRGLQPYGNGWRTTLVFHPKDVQTGDYFLKIKYNNKTEYYRGAKKVYLVHLHGAERWVFLHIVP